VTLLKTAFQGNIEFLMLSTRILYGLGRYDAADKENQDALLLDPDNTTGLLLRIQILDVLGTNDPYAKRLLSRVERELPDDADVLRLKARFLIKDGELEEALTVVEGALELFPDDDEFKKTYGRLLIDTGRSDQGKEVIENTLEKDPDSVENLEILLGQAEEEGNWAQAGEYIQRILEIDRSPDYLRRAVRIYTNYERYVTAVGFAAMLADEPEVTTDDLVEYAQVLVVLERSSQARDILNRALEGADTSRVRSLIHYRLGQIAETPEERYSALQDSIFEDPQNIEALAGYSAYFEELGDFVNARKWMARAVALLPDDEGEQLRSRLAELEEKAGE
jgi:tetratricopeptide (TPR) repeat protein